MVAEIAVVNFSALDHEAVAVAVAACDLQLRDHLQRAWPNLPYYPARFYPSAEALPPPEGLVRLIVVSDTIDARSTPGYDDKRTVLLAQEGETAAALSNELISTTADPECKKWIHGPTGLVAFEICSPCEMGRYALELDVGLTRHAVLVSSFLAPSWFRKNGEGAFEVQAGGYVIRRDGRGRAFDYWDNTDAAVLMRRALKRANSTSRLYRRGVR